MGGILDGRTLFVLSLWIFRGGVCRGHPGMCSGMLVHSVSPCGRIFGGFCCCIPACVVVGRMLLCGV